MSLFFVAAVLAFAIALALTPWIGRLAREHRLLDYPDTDRRRHEAPVPRSGGVAIFAATATAVAAVVLWDRSVGGRGLQVDVLTPGVIAGCIIVFITGIVDDVRGVSPPFKLLAQTLAALAAVAYGFRVDVITIAGGGTFDLAFLAIPVTVFWIVGMTNAFNLVDGVDGLAGSCALIGLTSCIVVDLLLQDTNSLLVTFAMLGAVFAFLRFNQHPARVFLGDSGSMLLGYFLAIRTVTSATGPDRVTFALIPLFVLAYPIVDTFIAIARRWLRGHPFSRADGRHVHHQILALGLSPTRTVELLSLFFFSVATMGISIVFAPPRVTLALGGVAAILGFSAFFYGIRWLRYTEFMEFAASVQSVLRNARSHVRNKVVAAELASRLLQARSDQEVQELLTNCAADFGLLEVSIIPASQHFHQPSTRQISPLAERPFRVDYPIAWESNGEVNEVVLRIWCDRPNDKQHIGAERIATRLASALELWLKANPGAFGTASSDQGAIRSGTRSPRPARSAPTS